MPASNGCRARIWQSRSLSQRRSPSSDTTSAACPLVGIHADLRVARAFGDTWIRDLRTAVLVVPSVVAHREESVLINLRHPDFKNIVAGTLEPVVWDSRLFAPR